MQQGDATHVRAPSHPPERYRQAAVHTYDGFGHLGTHAGYEMRNCHDSMRKLEGHVCRLTEIVSLSVLIVAAHEYEGIGDLGTHAAYGAIDDWMRKMEG